MGEPRGRLAVTDAHLHLWDRSGGGYAWLDDAPEGLRRDARWEQVAPQLSVLDVDRVVLVQADDALADTRALQRAAARIESEALVQGQVEARPEARVQEGTVHRADVVAWLPLADPSAVAVLLEDRAAMERIVGARHLVHDDPDAGFLDRSPVRESLTMLAAKGLPLDVPDAFPRHLDQAARIAEEVEGLVVVLDHLGKPPLGHPDRMDDWAIGLRRLAALPTAVAKLSGLSTSGEGYSADDDLRRALDLALEVLGPGRLMYGSDWPIAPVPFDLARGTGRLHDLLGELPGGARDQILSITAERIYRRIV